METISYLEWTIKNVGDAAAACMNDAAQATAAAMNEMHATLDSQRALASCMERELQREEQAVADPFIRALSVYEQHARFTVMQLPSDAPDVPPPAEVSCMQSCGTYADSPSGITV